MPNILVVDDEPGNFRELETLLSNHGYHIYYASNGNDGIQMLDIFDVEVILLACSLPGCSGFEVCRKLKAHSDWSTIPVIMVASSAASEEMTMCLQAGADDLISKPINSFELRARLQSMTRIREQIMRLKRSNDIQAGAIAALEGSLATLRENFASTIPHEFNTPLMGILFSLELVLGEIESLEDCRTKQLLDISYRSAIRLESTTQRFLRYAKLESKDQPPAGEVEVTDVYDIANQLINRHDRMADFSCKLEAQRLNISSEHLEWIVSEILDNACKFSESGTRVEIEGSIGEDGMYNLVCYDSGRGLTSGQIESIGAFMQFERDIYEQQGAGLGLTIAMKTAKLHGGECLVTSRYGERTVVHIRLPCADPADKSLAVDD